MAQIEPLTPPVCKEMVQSCNWKAVARPKEMGKGVSYSDQQGDTDNHQSGGSLRSAL